MQRNYETLVEFLQKKEKAAHRAIWIEPTIKFLSANAGFIEEVLNEAQQGVFSQQSVAGERLQTELLRMTRGALEGRGRSVRLFVKEYFSKYLAEYLAEHRENYAQVK